MAPATRLRLFYLLYYGNVGTYLPYFAAYLRGRGFSGEQIGTVQMLPSLLAPVAAISWASFADHRASPQRALRLSTGWAALAVLLLPFAREPWQVGAVVLLMSVGDRAVVPLADSITLEWCRDHPGTSYARIRLFGSIGFILLSLAVGRALTLRGDRPADLLVPIVVVLCVGGYALAARGAPASARHVDRPVARDLADLARDRRLHLLLAASALHWAACAPFHLLFGVFVRDLGLTADVTGAGMGLGVLAEIVVLLSFPRLEARLPLRALFAIAFVSSAVRWALLSRATGPAAIATLQLLHGLTFGLFWGSATRALADLVPARLRATGQAIFTAVVFGGGNAAGYALSGIGYDRLGGVGPLFAAAAVAELLALAVVLAPLAPRGAVSGRSP
jgi:PPP family 3-phenylpropionic acid transporter